MSKLNKCPLCGYDGDDIVFKFCCTNKECDNYDPDLVNEAGSKSDSKASSAEYEDLDTFLNDWPFTYMQYFRRQLYKILGISSKHFEDKK